VNFRLLCQSQHQTSICGDDGFEIKSNIHSFKRSSINSNREFQDGIIIRNVLLFTFSQIVNYRILRIFLCLTDKYLLKNPVSVLMSIPW
jgi:hypothetical protein